MKKKLLSLILAVCMICSTLVTIGVTATAADGSVNADSIAAAIAAGETVYIEGVNDLKAFMEYGKTNTFDGAKVELKANIDATGVTWTPIAEFKGTFDGGNFTISNLNVGQGFFSKLEGTVMNVNFDNCVAKDNTMAGVVARQVPANFVATINNVNVNNPTVAPLTTTSAVYLGGFVGIVYGKILMDDCHTVGGSVIAGDNVSGGEAGGLVARLSGTNVGSEIQNCSNSATVNAVCAGGMVGQSRDEGGFIMNCVNTGIIKANNANNAGANTYIGGIMGAYFWDCSNSKIANCTNSGTITVTVAPGETVGTGFAAGILGYAGKAITIENCVNLKTATVTTNGWNAGGILACATESGIAISGCVNYADVNQTAGLTVTNRPVNAGGILGQSKAVGTIAISNCANFGNVSAKNTSSATYIAAGGIVGGAWNNSGVGSHCLAITDCINTGDVTATTGKKAGGLVGYYAAKTGTFKNCIVTGTRDVDNGYGEGLINTVGTNNTDANSYVTIQSVYYLAGTSATGNSNRLITMWATTGAANGNFKVVYPADQVDFLFLGGTHNVATDTLKDQGGNFALYNSMFTGEDNPNIPAGTNYKTGALVASLDSLSGVEGAAFLMTAGFDFAEDWYITSGLPVPTDLALSKQALNEEAEVVYKGYQNKLVNGVETTASIRLVAGLNSLDFANTGYELSALDNGRIFSLPAQTTTTVYTSLNAYVEGVNTPITAEAFDSAYLSAITVNDLPVDSSLFLIVKPFVTNFDGSVSYGSMVIIVIENGNVVNQYS